MRTIINWNRKWAFTKQADSIPTIMPNTWYFVNLPHTWNAIDGQDGGNDGRPHCCQVIFQNERKPLLLQGFLLYLLPSKTAYSRLRPSMSPAFTTRTR